MPDPNAKNLTDSQVGRIKFTHPLWNKYKLAQRMQTMRRDLETGELDSDNVVALGTLTADHTLVEPGGDASADDKTEITSRLITVSATGTDRKLTLPAAADFEGELSILVIDVGAGATLRVWGAAGYVQVDADEDGYFLKVFSDGSKWIAENPDGSNTAGGSDLLDHTA